MGLSGVVMSEKAFLRVCLCALLVVASYNLVASDIGITIRDVNISEEVKVKMDSNKVIDAGAPCLIIQAGNQLRMDSEITAKIKNIYSKEKILENELNSVTFIQVETSEGVVYLTGKVDTKVQEEKAERLAKSVKGVKEVKSSLKILNDWRSQS